MAKGSLSVFFSMVLVSVMTLLLTMAECIRVYELHSFSTEYTDMAVESAFSEFNPYLWANYRILALDLGYGTGSIGPDILASKTIEYCGFNADVNNNYARISPDECKVNKYALLTDNNAQGVVMLGKKAAMEGLASQVVDEIKSQIDDMNSIEKIDVEQTAEEGDASLENAKEQQLTKKYVAANDDNPDTNPDDYETPKEVEDNPFRAFKMIKESFARGILSTVTDAENVSETTFDLEQLPSHRNLNTGNMEVSSGNDLVEKALFIEYLMTNYSSFNNDLKHDGMRYEIEYLIAGKESDSQSLATVVGEILLLREAANFATIMQNPSMVSEAMAMAEILAGFTLNPAIIEAVKYAIIAAWAYVESTLDVRLLLSGGKVPLVKTLDQWTSDVWHLSAVADINFKAREFQTGISYSQYLIGFLALNNNETLAIRACDVMENALHSTDQYKNAQMDNMAFAADISIDYAGEEIFLSVFDSPEEDVSYNLTKSRYLSY